MKRLSLIIMVLALSGCQSNNQPAMTICNMHYSCNGNVACINSMRAYSGNGSFSSETDYLAWETGFLNSFGYSFDPVTACSCSSN